MIDSHAHLNFDDFDADRKAVRDRAHAAGIHTIINIATDFETCQQVIALAEEFDNMYAVVGVHPHDAKTWQGSQSQEQLRTLAQHPKVVAIGEIGLDYYRNLSPKSAQKTAFAEQIAVAKDLGLPIVIHNRDAFDDTFAMLLETEAFSTGGVFHCFSGTPDEAQKTIDLGFYISVNGILTYKNATMADVAATAPLNKILLETDCPFLSPHPFRGKRNEPAYVAHIAEKLADIRSEPLAEITRVTDDNVRRLFKLPTPINGTSDRAETATS